MMKVFLAAFVFFSFFITSAEATSRKVYFSLTTKNITTTTQGANTDLQSDCTITISNPSSVSQTFSITPTISSSGVGVLNGAASYSCTGKVPASNSTTCTQNVVLEQNEIQTITWVYKEFPAHTAGTQTTTCAGIIDISDTTATSPGFLVGNGNIRNFIESTSARNLGGTGTTFTGGSIFKQTSIILSEGRPF